MRFSMRVLVPLLLVVFSMIPSGTAIHHHHHHRLQQLQTVLQETRAQAQTEDNAADTTQTQTQTQTQVSATVIYPFPQPHCVPGSDLYIRDCPHLFYTGGVLTNAVVPLGAVGAANLVGATSPWIMIMNNLPVGGAGAGAACPANTVNAPTTCAAAGVPNEFGLYHWGTAAPVYSGVGTVWNCPAGPTGVTYVGITNNALTGLTGRCGDYNTGVWGTVGDHQSGNFQAALNRCECLYYRYRTYAAANFAYTVTGATDAVVNGLAPLARAGFAAVQGRVSRNNVANFGPARSWNFLPDPANVILAQELEQIRLIRVNAMGARLGWYYPWNVQGRIGLVFTTCPVPATCTTSL